jgi:WD40 repeat protein
LLNDSVRVPAEAGLGLAKVTLSFDAWKAGQVTPAQLTLPVVDATPTPVTPAERPAPREPQVTDSPELLRTYPQEKYVAGLAYSPDGQTLVSIDQGAGIHLWDPATGERRRTIPLPPQGVEVFAPHFSPDGKRLVATGREVQMSPDGKRYEKWLGWRATVWDASDGRQLAQVRKDGPVNPILIGFEGHSLLLTLIDGEPWNRSPKRSRVVRVNVPEGEEQVLFQTEDRESYLIALSPDATLGVLLLEPTRKLLKTELHFLDLRTGRTRPLLERVGNRVAAATFSPDGKTVAIAVQQQLRFWDCQSGSELLDLSERYATFLARPENQRLERIANLQYSPDGVLLALAHDVQDIPSRQNVAEFVLWEPATGQCRAILRGHKRGVIGVRFALDGKTLASGGFDKVVKLWAVPAR